MKLLQLGLLLIIGTLLLSSCASQKNTFALPSATPYGNTDRDILLDQVVTKSAHMPYKGIRSVNEFIDANKEALYDPTAKVVVMTVKKKEFPYVLEPIMRSNILLNALPREKDNLVLKGNTDVPGVWNVYYRVDAKHVPLGEQQPKKWMPNRKVWKRYIDQTMNLMKDKDPEDANYSFFYMANVEYNPELIIAVKGDDNAWDWNRMPHPKKTLRKAMLVLLATADKEIIQLLK